MNLFSAIWGKMAVGIAAGLLFIAHSLSPTLGYTPAAISPPPQVSTSTEQTVASSSPVQATAVTPSKKGSSGQSSGTAANLIASSNNGLACQTVAEDAVSNDQKKNGDVESVLSSYFDPTQNKCYYEVFITITKNLTQAFSETDIRVAPNDTWIAYCSTATSPELCGEHNSGLITQQQFHQLEAQYLGIATSTLPTQPAPTVNPPAQNLPNIIAEWSPSVALVSCTFNDGTGDFGSGFLYLPGNGSIEVITNRHVIISETTGDEATSCSVQIPGDGNNLYTEASTNFSISSDGYDWGSISVPDGDAYFNSVANKKLTICTQQAQTGDNVVVLGYPDYAGQFTQPTATQGIISGYAAPYYTTSAQIESGNSGGVAINPDLNCYIGIPSAVQTGKYANLGRILNANVPFQLAY